MWPTNRDYSDQVHPCDQSARVSQAAKNLSDKAETAQTAVAKMYESEQYWIRVARDRSLVIGRAASALGIKDLESAHNDPAVILDAIKKIKGVRDEKTHSAD